MSIKWRDKTYLIKNSETNGDWSVFRRVQFHDYLIEREETTMNFQTGEFETKLIVERFRECTKDSLKEMKPLKSCS